MVSRAHASRRRPGARGRGRRRRCRRRQVRCRAPFPAGEEVVGIAAAAGEDCVHERLRWPPARRAPGRVYRLHPRRRSASMTLIGRRVERRAHGRASGSCPGQRSLRSAAQSCLDVLGIVYRASARPPRARGDGEHGTRGVDQNEARVEGPRRGSHDLGQAVARLHRGADGPERPEVGGRGRA